MAFRLTPLAIPNMRTDYGAENSAFANLGQTLGNLPALYRQGQERREMAEIGQGIAAGTLDYNQAAGRIASLGKLDTAFDLLKLGEARKQRELGAEASRALGEALGGGSILNLSGSPASTPALSRGQDSALPTALKMSESGGNWTAQNNEVGAGGQRGHFGRAQFGQARLREAAAAGAIPAGTTPQQFMRSPELQKAAENWHFNDIDQFIAGNGLNRAIGASINGIPVTIEGMRNVAHLGGKEGLAKFISSGGRYNPSDANGTSLIDYLRLGARGSRTAEADLPAPGSGYAEAASGERGFFLPPGGQDGGMAPVDPMGNVTGPAPQAMSPQTFGQVAGATEAVPMPPVFQSEGIGQPWMNSTIPHQPVARTAGQVAPRSAMEGEILPPPRPYDLNADRFAAGGSPTVAQMPQQRLPAPIEIDPNSPDGGSRAFAAAQGRNAPVADPAGFAIPSAPPNDAAAFARATGGASGQELLSPSQPAQYTGPGTASPSAAPVLTKDMPRPTTREEAQTYTATRQMESRQGHIGKLATALANPNLPANARAVGEIFLKDALEQSKAPDSVKEFLYARGMGWTTAKTPGEYAKEKQNAPTSVQEYEYAQRQGYNGSILDFERDRAAGKAKQGMSASDQKAIYAAEDELPNLDNALTTLSRAKELNRQTYTGAGAGAKGWAGTSGIPGTGLIFDQQKAMATREFGQIMSMEAIQAMSNALKGATTNFELGEFQRLLSDPSTPPDIRERTIDRMMTLAARQRDIARGRINDLRGKSGLDPLEWNGQGRPNAGASSGQRPSGQRPAPQPAQGGKPPLPGARLAPDGNWYAPDPNRQGGWARVD
ncbi:hypothetical protein ACQKLX_07295 [Bosea sp. NPDC003192]|uniref:hypothetical protein n=1 Tax=Bosea sp. NPDC003192 TaxID=3390551 RepID=UPI003CFEBB67